MKSFAMMMMVVAAVWAGAALGAGVLQAERPFVNDVVVRAQLTEGNQGFMLELIERFNLDVWAEHGDGQLDIRVNKVLLDFLKTSGVDFEIYVEDVQALVDAETERRAAYTGARNAWFEEYHRYDDQIGYYQDLCAANSAVCSMEVIGESYEGRNIYEIHLAQGNPDRAVFLDAGIHAREWISSTTLQYLFTQLVNSTLISDFEWIIIPHLNPDGYEYSWGLGNRMWRKSRNINAGTNCIGTDLNRNWPTPTWGGAGSSSNPCSDTYHGSAAASEPEVALGVERFLIAVERKEVVQAITFHAYSQLWLRPWGHTNQDAPDEPALFAWGQAICDAIRSVHGLTYQNIKSISLYPTTGTTSDWYYHISPSTSYGSHAFSATPELRDTGRYGFMLPEDQIIPQGEEMWAGLVASANFFPAIEN